MGVLLLPDFHLLIRYLLELYQEAGNCHSGYISRGVAVRRNQINCTTAVDAVRIN